MVTMRSAKSNNRRLIGAYNGPIFRLRRTSDGAERDFYCLDGENEVPEDTVRYWAGDSEVTFVTLYDQVAEWIEPVVTTADTLGRPKRKIRV